MTTVAFMVAIGGSPDDGGLSMNVPFPPTHGRPSRTLLAKESKSRSGKIGETKDVQQRLTRRKTMTMFPQPIGPIPEETRRIARAANPKGTLAIWLRDELGTIYTDEDFSDLYPERSQPSLAPWRLALV